LTAPLLARFALDAQESFMTAVTVVPSGFQELAPAGLSSGAWTVTHAAEAHQVWIGEYAGGFARDAWFDAFRQDPNHAPAFQDAIGALGHVMEQTTAVLNKLTESDLTRAGKMLETSRFSGWTVGQLLARAIAHLYLHAVDLTTLSALNGGDDSGLPGFMNHVRIAP
jgi:DinB superfamily